MSILNLFIQDWNSICITKGVMDAQSTRKFWKLVNHIGSSNEDNKEKWLRILAFCQSMKNANNSVITNLAHDYIKVSNIMSKKDESKVQMIDETVRIELSPKVTVIVFQNNSCIFTRKIAGNAVTMTVKIPDLYNEAEATRLLYLGSETGAFDILKKIRKLVEQKRFMGIEFDETLEDIL